MVPFTLSLVLGSVYKGTSPKMGTVVIIWLLGYQGPEYLQPHVPETRANARKGSLLPLLLCVHGLVQLAGTYLGFALRHRLPTSFSSVCGRHDGDRRRLQAYRRGGEPCGPVHRLPSDGRSSVSAGPVEQTARDGRERCPHICGLEGCFGYTTMGALLTVIH